MADDATAPEQVQSATEGTTRSLSLLARESFGAGFHGTVDDKQPEATEHRETPHEEASADIEAEAETDEHETPEPETPEVGEEREEQDGDDGESIKSFQELVETQNFDWDWFKTLSTPVNVDGETVDVSFSDLVKSYRSEEGAKQRVEQATAEAQALTQEVTQQREQLEGQLVVAAELIGAVENQLDSEAGSIDWKRLREDDPAEYAAKKDEIRERRQQLDAMKAKARETYRSATAEQQAKAKKQQAEYLAEQRGVLLEALPDWRDAEKAKVERESLVTYLRGSGFDEQDIRNAADARLVILARKAMLYDEGKAKVNAAKKRVAKVPKTLKPGTPKPQDQINQERFQKQRARLRETGSIEDAAALLRASRKN